MLEINSLKQDDLLELKIFADLTIGCNYYSLQDLKEIHIKSQKQQTMCSFVLREQKNRSSNIVGFCFRYPSGNWNRGKGQKLCPDLWNVPIESVGYFQSTFLSEHLRGQGWGLQLARVSLEALRQTGSQAVVAHSWVESPRNSSEKYLRKLGFIHVALHSEYWKDINYFCTYDGNPCRCSAREMILYL